MFSTKGFASFRNALLLLPLLAVAPASAQEAEPAAPSEVWLRDELAVSYAARIEDDWLIVEVRHGPGWHTYAMDNVLRAAEATGKDTPDTELPTRITPSAEIELAPPWRQTPPADLSQPDIRWYTWGVEERSFFAARTLRAAPGGSVQVDAQACTDRLCAMVDALRVPVTHAAERSVDPETLVPVGSGESAGEGEADADAMAGIRNELSVFGDWFQRAMDLECSGKVPDARLVGILNPGRHRPRQMNWALALDADADGFVEQGEVGLGLWRNLDHQVTRRMLGDVNGDGALNPQEYALFVPDPGAETNAERVSELQEARFATYDKNGDRLVTRHEISTSVAASYIARHWGLMLLFHLRRADSDGDGAVTPGELTDAIETAGGTAAQGALDAWFDAAEQQEGGVSSPRKLALADLPALLINPSATAEDRHTFEAPLNPLLVPSCGSASNEPN